MSIDDAAKPTDAEPLPKGQTGESSQEPAEGSDGTPPPTKDSPQA